MGQQIAFIILIVLSGMILTQIFLIKKELRKEIESLKRVLQNLNVKL